MANELQPLSLLFQNRLFRIPDYQRGYAWLQPQLVDFWDDLVNLQSDSVRYHYTGLLSLKSLNSKETESLGEDLWLVENGYKPCHIVDGQQRITTFVILLNEIVRFVRRLEENKDKPDREITLGYETIEEIVSKYICKKRPPNGVVTTYLFGYEEDNPSAEYMKYKVFEEEPYSSDVKETYYTKNLKIAKNFFAENIEKLYKESGTDGLEAINTLYKKLTQRLKFNLYEIDDDYDVFVAFETMNNRGKKLTNLELLKNRLIYLTTLYDDDVFDKTDKSALRKKINEAWKEVYSQLGRNKSVPLSDDDFLRTHWIIYCRYSQRGDDYIKFLLSKFSSKGIFEKTPVLVEAETEPVISNDIPDADDTETVEAEEQETIEVSKLQPEEIDDYVNSLKDMAKYWYDTYFPFESSNLTEEEKKRVDRLNRISIRYFRPLVTAIISRRDISPNSRVKIFDAIERFIFVAFCLDNFKSYGSSYYYRAANQVYVKEKDVDELCGEISGMTEEGRAFATQNFVTRIEKYFSKGNGYYDWNGLRYFFYEYEASLAQKNNIDRCTWAMFTKSEKDKVSIEHILPQTPTPYWRNMFRQFNDGEIKMLSGALGNLLPLNQSVNSALQNDSFEDKKRSKSTGRRGYENGSHSEIEVSKLQNWTALEIYNRTKKLLDFMQERWKLEFNEEQLNKLIGFSLK